MLTLAAHIEMKKAIHTQDFFVLTDELSADARGYLVRTSYKENPKSFSLKDLSALYSETSLSSLVIVIPGANLLQAFIDAPKTSGSKLEKAIYWSIEPLSISSLEENEFFWQRHPSTERPNRCLGILVSKTLLSEWKTLLRSLGLGKASLTSLSQLLINSDKNHEWQNFVFWQDQTGVGCLKSEIASDSKIKNAMLLTNEAKGVEGTESLINVLGKKAKYIDLNHYADNTSSWQLFFPLKTMVAASLASLILICSYFLFMGSQMNKRTNELEHLAIENYKAWFPNDQKILNLRRQLEGKLKSGQIAGTNTISDLLELIAKSLEQTVDTYSVERLRYQDQPGSLQLVLIIERMDDLDQLDGILSARNIDMDVQSATRKSSGLEVGLLVSPR